MVLCPEHPKRDQNPKFTPLSETTSIPVCFIWEFPPPPTPGPEIKLPESELLRNELKLLVCLLVFFNIFFKSNLYTQFMISIVYNPLLGELMT